MILHTTDGKKVSVNPLGLVPQDIEIVSAEIVHGDYPLDWWFTQWLRDEVYPLMVPKQDIVRRVVAIQETE